MFERALGEVAPDGALIADHEEDVLLRGDLGQALAHLVALAQAEQVVVEEEHADDVHPVVARFELRQDHGAQLVGRRHVGGENVCDVHRSGSSSGASLDWWIMTLLPLFLPSIIWAIIQES